MAATVLAAAFWLMAWQLAAVAIGQKLFLVGPVEVCRTLVRLMGTGQFWATVSFSTGRIVGGFALGLAAGTALAGLAAAVPFVAVLLRVPMVTVRSIPVASFIVLALVWLRSAGNLAVFISFLIVLPVVYTNVLKGLSGVDGQLLEMARVFRFTRWGKVKNLYIPAAWPYFDAAARVSVGLCWKSGVAAEVIGITAGSIGEQLYDAKLLFDTAGLLAWTAVIVALSLVFEKVFLRFLAALRKVLFRVTGPVTAPAGGVPEAVGLSEVTMAYGGQVVLARCTVRFPKARPTCVMAPSGRGKTTLLRVLLGLAQPRAGRADTGGAAIAAAFQEDRLLDWLSARDNVRLVCGAGQEALNAAFEAVGLTAADADKRADELSGGQRRRVAVLRAVLADGAGAVVLDEPFKGLDDAARARTAAFVKARCAGRPLAVVTHEEQDAALLDAQVVRLPCPGGAAPKVPPA